MWAPWYPTMFDPQGSAQSTTASEEDRSFREFEVAFSIECPQWRGESTPLTMRAVETISLSGHGRQEAECWFKPDSNGRLAEVSFRIAATTSREALGNCKRYLADVLGFLTLETGAGLQISRWAVHDVKHGAKWCDARLVPGMEPFWLPDGILINEEYKAVLSLYREGRNSASPYYRLLCFYKILEAWYNKTAVFGLRPDQLQKRGFSLHVPKRKISRGMLIYCGALAGFAYLEGMSFGELFDKVLRPYRVKVAHAITEEGDFLNLDILEEREDACILAALADIVARQLLLDQTALWNFIKAIEGQAPGVINAAIIPTEVVEGFPKLIADFEAAWFADNKWSLLTEFLARRKAVGSHRCFLDLIPITLECLRLRFGIDLELTEHAALAQKLNTAGRMRFLLLAQTHRRLLDENLKGGVPLELLQESYRKAGGVHRPHGAEMMADIIAALRYVASHIEEDAHDIGVVAYGAYDYRNWFQHAFGNIRIPCGEEEAQSHPDTVPSGPDA